MANTTIYIFTCQSVKCGLVEQRTVSTGSKVCPKCGSVMTIKMQKLN